MAKRRKQGGILLHRLFLEPRQFPRIEDVPLAARHALVDVLLAESSIEQASSVMATIDEPPEVSDKYMWHLRRARILVLGGQKQKGAVVLNDVLEKNTDLSREQLDRLLQVVFDLQTVGAHEEAYQLFNRVIAKNQDAKLTRELYYWMADSRKAQGQYQESARLYLKSALHEQNGLDPWGQTARYQAAEALAKAKLVTDARRLFMQLLATTKEPDRRAVLQQQLQSLWTVDEQSENQEDTDEHPAN